MDSCFSLMNFKFRKKIILKVAWEPFLCGKEWKSLWNIFSVRGRVWFKIAWPGGLVQT